MPSQGGATERLNPEPLGPPPSHGGALDRGNHADDSERKDLS